jgi:hypothetical protein
MVCPRAHGGVLYDADTGLSSFGSVANHYAQQVTLAGPDEAYSINEISLLGLNWYNVSVGAQEVSVNFYTGANLGPTATNALATAISLSGFSYDLNAPGADGIYDVALQAPVQVPSNTFTVVVTITNTAGTAYSSGLGASFTAGTPTIGSNPGFLWNDSNEDGIFSSSEQSGFGLGTTFNLDMQLDPVGTAPTTYFWNSATGGNWESAALWNPHGPPTLGDLAVFNLSSNPTTAPGYTVVVNSAADACKNLTVESDRVNIALTAADTAALTVYGTLTVGQQVAGATGTTDGFLTLNKSGTGGPAYLNVAAGSVAVGTNGGTGSLTVGPNVELLVSGNLSIGNASSVILQPGALLYNNTLTIAGGTNGWTGRLDITTGSLDMTGASLATVTNQIREGCNLAGGANWNGPGGITSSTAAADTRHLTAVGVIQNNQSGTANYGPTRLFENDPYITAGTGDILVAYTFFGDANLDGKVDGSDYSLIDAGYASNRPGFTGTVLTGWYNGDFNYDGVIDGSDYALIDNAYNNQSPYGADASAQLATVIAAPIPGTVPEPATTAALFGTAMLGLRPRPKIRRVIVPM